VEKSHCVRRCPAKLIRLMSAVSCVRYHTYRDSKSSACAPILMSNYDAVSVIEAAEKPECGRLESKHRCHSTSPASLHSSRSRCAAVTSYTEWALGWRLALLLFFSARVSGASLGFAIISMVIYAFENFLSSESYLAMIDSRRR
jgi:hypothetical protein